MKNSRAVYILHGAFYSGVVDMFKENGYQSVKTPKDADAIVFIGGGDVDPSLYGEKPIMETGGVDIKKDAFERSVFEAFKGKKPFIGICRGGQLLNVLNGGKLWQHVLGHNSTHPALDLETKRVLRISSIHHQMMRPTKDAEIFLVASESSVFKAQDEIKYVMLKGQTQTHDDIEGVFYPQTKSLCFQSHPEIGPTEHTKYFFEKIHEKLGV